MNNPIPILENLIYELIIDISMANPQNCNIFFYVSKYLSPFFMLPETNFLFKLILNVLFWFMLSFVLNLLYNMIKTRKFSKEYLKPSKIQFKIFIVLSIILLIVGFMSRCAGILE